ncbi:MAG TPA: thioredoxin family protein [Candidatus Paceibacterota bacterium]|nr:thioredoxin family protein [Candidatus Paceibacterota bacterium]
MSKYTSWIIIGIAVVLIIGGIVWYGDQPGQYDQFATCIKDSGATFFGAFWCPHCQEQKSLFGKSWKKLPYVECSTPDGQGQTEICKTNNIESYPTWQWKSGDRKTGVLTFDELSQFTGCPAIKG